MAVVLFAVFFLSTWLTERFRRYALRTSLVDVPNPRSSHVIATPRGGGVAIVVSTLIALAILTWMKRLEGPDIRSICMGGAAVASIGFMDDQFHLTARWRLLGYFVVAIWTLSKTGGAPPIAAMGFVLAAGWFGFALAVLYVVWMLNLMNFMDGIDGIASVEAITVCAGAALLSIGGTARVQLWVAPLVLASATLGFLVWNWPPARIFMGDTGSGFLGFMIALLSLQAGWEASRLFWSWVILMGVFVVDATVTLIRRVASGQQFYEAHRSHAYQHAARWREAHRPVTAAVGIVNLCWLFPVALAVTIGKLDGLMGVVISYVPLVVAAYWLNAGKRSPQ